MMSVAPEFSGDYGDLNDGVEVSDSDYAILRILFLLILTNPDTESVQSNWASG